MNCREGAAGTEGVGKSPLSVIVRGIVYCCTAVQEFRQRDSLFLFTGIFLRIFCGRQILAF